MGTESETYFFPLNNFLTFYFMELELMPGALAVILNCVPGSYTLQGSRKIIDPEATN